MTALLLLSPGTPMLFQGQEFASSSPFLFFADMRDELTQAVREGRRGFLGQFRSLADRRMQHVFADLGRAYRDTDEGRTVHLQLLAQSVTGKSRGPLWTLLGAVLAVAYERDLRNFASLLLLEKVGPRTLQSLALIAEVVHGAPSRFADPARFAFAHGGKDGHPFPVPLKTYDQSLAVLRRGLDSARLGHTERLDGMRRLDNFVRAVECNASPVADFHAALSHERAISPSLAGRTVFDDHSNLRKPRTSAGHPERRQLPLFN